MFHQELQISILNSYQKIQSLDIAWAKVLFTVGIHCVFLQANFGNNHSKVQQKSSVEANLGNNHSRKVQKRRLNAFNSLLSKKIPRCLSACTLQGLSSRAQLCYSQSTQLTRTANLKKNELRSCHSTSRHEQRSRLNGKF